MKNSLKLLLAALMGFAMFVPAQAETMTLTLFDVDTMLVANENAPITCTMVDTEGYTLQTIFPEADLAPMLNQEIYSMMFYLDRATTINGGELAISVGTTDVTAFPGWSPQPITGLTQVCTYSFTPGDSVVLITFDTPFVYEGGNLVFESKVVTATNWDEGCFIGMIADVNNVLIKRVYSSAVDRFYPMTTFTYSGNAPVVNPGDVDGNGYVNVTDVTMLINAVMSSNYGAIVFANADMDGNGDLTVTDVTMLINAVISAR
ncbi:MAG: dockerin type I repeat-containing protein [Muribaculaceae bacterium]|nr:dockerin type I repeat-containing protein [Muribaculaceae bacterium]